MKSKAILVALLFLTSCATRSSANPQSTEGGSKTDKPQLSQEQIQQNMKEAGATTEQHSALKRMIGSWNVEAKFWMDPNGKPEVSKGKAVNKSILGDRFIESSYKGKMMGQNFEGRGFVGYDTVAKKYFSTWIDSLNTGLFESRGVANADNTKITFNADFTCPATRSQMQTEEVVTFVDNNHYTYESFEVTGGKRIKHMELNYSKK